MAKVYGGITANFYGKVGNVVGRIRQGRTIMSIYQPKVLNPKTPSQELARRKFALLTGLFKCFSGFLRTSFRDLDGYKTGNPFSAAIGYNFRLSPSVFVGSSAANVAISYPNVQVSQGAVDLPYSPSCTVDGTDATFTWADNSGMGNALATDKVMVVVLNPTKNAAVSNIELADRNERNATFSLPTAWSGDEVQVWLAMRRADNSVCSDSIHLGAFPL